MNAFTASESVALLGVLDENSEPLAVEEMARQAPATFRVGRPDMMRSVYAQSAAYALDESTLLALTYLQLQAAIK